MESVENLTSGQLSKADIDWAVTSMQQKAEQIRQYCLRHPEADQSLILAGHILDRVYGDFNSLFAGPLMIASRKPEPTRQVFLIKLKWIVEQPQTPADLREKLEKTIETIADSKWESAEDLVKGETIWKENAQDEVTRRISVGKKQEELPLPIDPYKKAWDSYWHFEYGRRDELRADARVTK